MRRQFLAAAIAVLTVAASAVAQQPPAAPPQPQKMNQEDINKLSEAFGHFIGRNLNAPGVKFDLEKIIKGIREGYAGKPAPMSDQEYEMMMGLLQQQVFEQLADENLRAAEAFMQQNAKSPGVFEVEAGKLQYQVLNEGKGVTVKAEGSPVINYTGRYLDGSVFDSSDSAQVPLQQTIPGFSRGVAGMKEGEKRKIFVHPDMGYGLNSPLPPNALLIFEVEVIQADPPKKEKPKQ